MNINSRNIFIVYLFLYFSLLVGFYFNEDFAGGYLKDYLLHKSITDSFDENFIESFFNYDKFVLPHSPVYIIFFLILKKIFFNEIFVRLIGLHLSLLIPFFFVVMLKN